MKVNLGLIELIVLDGGGRTPSLDSDVDQHLWSVVALSFSRPKYRSPNNRAISFRRP